MSFLLRFLVSLILFKDFDYVFKHFGSPFLYYLYLYTTKTVPNYAFFENFFYINILLHLEVGKKKHPNGCLIMCNILIVTDCYSVSYLDKSRFGSGFSIFKSFNLELATTNLEPPTTLPFTTW